MVGSLDDCSLGDRCNAKGRCEVCLLRGVVRGVSLLCVLQGVVASMRLKEVLAVIIYDFRITASQGGLGCSLRLPVCNVH